MSGEFTHVITNAVSGEVTILPFTQQEIDQYKLLNPEPTDSQKKSKELAELYDVYSSDIQVLQSAWVSALIADGEFENDRKADIVAEITEIKSQYLSDVSAVKLKYNK